METIRIEQSNESLAGAGKRLALWTAFLGPGTAWLLQFTTNYALVRAACASGRVWPLYVTNIAFLFAAAACGVVGWGQWRRPGRADDPVALERTRFMGL